MDSIVNTLRTVSRETAQRILFFAGLMAFFASVGLGMLNPVEIESWMIFVAAKVALIGIVVHLLGRKSDSRIGKLIGMQLMTYSILFGAFAYGTSNGMNHEPSWTVPITIVLVAFTVLAGFFLFVLGCGLMCSGSTLLGWLAIFGGGFALILSAIFVEMSLIARRKPNERKGVSLLIYAYLGIFGTFVIGTMKGIFPL